jgi:hypothetical protein
VKQADAAGTGDRSRARGLGGSASQAISIDDNTQGSTQPTSPRRAIAAASQALDFESQVRDAVPEAAIVASPEGSIAAMSLQSIIWILSSPRTGFVWTPLEVSAIVD